MKLRSAFKHNFKHNFNNTFNNTFKISRTLITPKTTKNTIITNKEGNIILPALVVIFSLSVLCISMSMLVFSNRRVIKSFSDKKIRYRDANTLCERVLERFNAYMTLEETDAKNSEALYLIKNEFRDYNIEIIPVSDRINTSVLKSEILKNKEISSYIDTHTNNLGKYSYLNINLTDEKLMSDTLKDFNVRDMSSLFPLVNYLPMLNVHNVDEVLLKAILTYTKVSDVERKVDALSTRIRVGESITYKDLKEVINARDSSLVWDFLGVKTQIYSVNATFKDVNIHLIIGAVPYKRDKIREVESYKILEKSFT